VLNYRQGNRHPLEPVQSSPLGGISRQGIQQAAAIIAAE
jgi:hypothetical protein